jgi:hypothetical protein
LIKVNEIYLPKFTQIQFAIYYDNGFTSSYQRRTKVGVGIMRGTGIFTMFQPKLQSYCDPGGPKEPFAATGFGGSAIERGC